MIDKDTGIQCDGLIFFNGDKKGYEVHTDDELHQGYSTLEDALDFVESKCYPLNKKKVSIILKFNPLVEIALPRRAFVSAAEY